MLKEALSAKGDIAWDVDIRLNEQEDKVELNEASLNSVQSEIDTLKEDYLSTIAEAELLSVKKKALELQRQDILDKLKEKSIEKEDAINKALAIIQSISRRTRCLK